jgi:sRNA-binding carbon storage regulator CsrA
MASHAGCEVKRLPGDREPGNLVLTLEVGEQIVIDDGRVVVTCVSCGDKGARLAFESPKNVPIDRMKIHLLKLAAQK